LTLPQEAHALSRDLPQNLTLVFATLNSIGQQIPATVVDLDILGR
jgi:hypothetical protein